MSYNKIVKRADKYENLASIFPHKTTDLTPCYHTIE